MKRMRNRAGYVVFSLLSAVTVVEAAEKPPLQDIHLLLAGGGVSEAERFAPSADTWSPSLFKRWGWYGAPSYEQQYEKVALVPEIWKDLDNDGKSEYITVLKEETGERMQFEPGVKASATRARFLVGVFKQGRAGWTLIHKRLSPPHQLLTVFLEDVKTGFRIHVFESRDQCDDEEPHAYELRWDPKSKKIVSGFGNDELDPLWKSVDCGE